ncbi:ABC transporter ATP-binding protein [Natranaerobius thermophilus]|uniref:Oligopeptide/dipeptide ABC transporter, ATPase subunit n=1 Tax=Natranaerobius thermophilus (strain ATCC BAA-1301 / DSM 18059 / JW/NM-WN-LF) TaxID=457570 RepID=B2A2X5_NATTJ|nr:ABC transporter ATP-binding protein [Natranaerobius thermophilus]ACB86343.1 oligopeptide/dipeptide ABC transporter, ATPase subunit [Natranaerobius thermophilus JW/NM-WN-LF]
MEELLNVKNLKTNFYTDDGIVRAVDDVSFSVNRGQILGVVGESGCGKSVTSISIMRLIQDPGKIDNGEVVFRDSNLLDFSEGQMRKIRGNDISMIFQEPMSALNPVFTVKDQLGEAIKLHQGLSDKEAFDKGLEMLKKVGIPRAENVMHEYPHSLSGGMCQRVMIAMALSCNPELLIADEPTTALDVTIQAQILELIKELKNEYNSSIMLITHDLGVIAEMADHVIVMYTGKIVENTDIVTLFKNPRHPYTIGLINSRPDIKDELRELKAIPGSVPNLLEMPVGCSFHPRCEYKTEKCEQEPPPMVDLTEDHKVRCWNVDKTGGED